MEIHRLSSIEGKFQRKPSVGVSKIWDSHGGEDVEIDDDYIFLGYGAV
jgi:hypothetical protein